MSLALAAPVLAALGAMAQAPEAVVTTLGFVAAGGGVWLRGMLPPPSDAEAEAMILSAYAAM